MKQFKVTIKSSKGEIVLGGLGEAKDKDEKLAESALTGVDVKFDTIDENVKEKSHGMIARVTVRGQIIKQNHKAIKDVMQWAIDNDGETEYRQVVVEMIVAKNEEPYGYEIPEMFVVDYEESYHQEGEDDTATSVPDTFELKLSQHKSLLDDIKVF